MQDRPQHKHKLDLSVLCWTMDETGDSKMAKRGSLITHFVEHHSRLIGASERPTAKWTSSASDNVPAVSSMSIIGNHDGIMDDDILEMLRDRDA